MNLKSIFALGVVLALALALTLSGQQSYSTPGSVHRFWVGVVPTSTTNVTTGSVYLINAVFSTGATPGTLTVSDRGADCGGPCTFANAIAIAANTVYVMDFAAAGGGHLAPGGISILATGTVHGHIHYDTGLN